jgi:cation diffusion facilitator CzcD-associated flavoprotein CzcO
VFQRTAPWVTPRHDRPITEKERGRLRRFPLLRLALRLVIYLEREAFVIGFRNPDMMRVAERSARKHLAEQVKDPELRAQLTPEFRFGCKRILLSNTYLRALDRPNAAVVTSGIREVRAHGVVDSDGIEHPVDAIIFATGFHACEMDRRARADRARPGGIQRGRGQTDARHRLDVRRVHELVPRQDRAQQQPVARVHARLPTANPSPRPGRPHPGPARRRPQPGHRVTIHASRSGRRARR